MAADGEFKLGGGGSIPPETPGQSIQEQVDYLTDELELEQAAQEEARRRVQQLESMLQREREKQAKAVDLEPLWKRSQEKIKQKVKHMCIQTVYKIMIIEIDGFKSWIFIFIYPHHCPYF